MNAKKCILLLAISIGISCASGCGESGNRKGLEQHKHDGVGGHGHAAQNGGVPIVIGNEEYHIELVGLPGETAVHAYILDGHMEDYVRLEQPSFKVNVKLPTGRDPLEFHAVVDRATGETVGGTALFRAEAEWLKTVSSFDGVIPSINIRSRTFENIEFSYAEGNESGHSH